MDEAHNVEKIAEEVASFEININMLNGCLGELQNLLNQLTSDAKQFTSSASNIVEIITLTRNFQAYVRDFDCRTSTKIDGIDPENAVFEGKKIFEFFLLGS